MGKIAVVLLTTSLVVLPIVFGACFCEHNSCKQCDENVNGDRSRRSATFVSNKMTKESYYEPDEEDSKYESEGSFGSSNKKRATSGVDDYAGVTYCNQTKQTFCENVPNYPQAYVNWILANNSSALQFAIEDIIYYDSLFKNEEAPLCLISERFIIPRKALSRNNKWMYILQSDTLKFHQIIRIEVCREENSKCRIIDDFIEGYVSSCRQKYIYRLLSAISTSTGEIVRDFFRIPANCYCRVEFNPMMK